MKKEEPGEPKTEKSKPVTWTQDDEEKYSKNWKKTNRKVGKTFVAFIKKQPPPTNPS